MNFNIIANSIIFCRLVMICDLEHDRIAGYTATFTRMSTRAYDVVYDL